MTTASVVGWAAVSFVASGALGAPVPVLLSGSAAPGLPGLSVSPSQGRFSETGDLVVSGLLQGATTSTRDAFWIGPRGGLSLFWRSGQPAPGGIGGVTGRVIESGVFPGNGQFVFQGRTGSTTNSAFAPSIFVQGSGGASTPVATVNQQTPGFPSGWTYQNGTDEPFSGWSVNRNGEASFLGLVTDGAATQQAIFRQRTAGAVPSVEYVLGDPIAGLPSAFGIGAGQTFQTNLGRTYFNFAISEFVEPLGRRDVGVIENGQPVRTLGLTGQIAPGATPLSAFSGRLGTMNSVRSDGSFVYSERLDDGRTGVWRSINGQLSKIVLEGDQAPGFQAGVQFASGLSTSSPLSGSGHSVVTINVTGPTIQSSNATTIWSASPDGALSLIAQAGRAAPGISGYVIRDFESTSIVGGGLGAVAFIGSAALASDTNVNVHRALWAGLPGGELQLLAEIGTLFQVATGDVRTVANISIAPNSINDQNELLFTLRFSDNTQGLFVTTIPCASSGLMLGFGMMAGCRRRR